MTSATTQTLQNLDCYQCTQPMMIASGTTVTVSNTAITSINSNSIGSSYPPKGAIMRFIVMKPFTTGGTTTT